MPPALTEALIKAVQQSPLIATLVFIIIGGYKRWWVWGYQLKEMTADRDEWKGRALQERGLAARAVEATSKAVDKL